MFCYPVMLEYTHDTDEYIAEFPDVPGVYSVGDTEDEALLNAVDALETAFHYLVLERKPVPLASALNGRHGVIVPRAIKMRYRMLPTTGGTSFEL